MSTIASILFGVCIGILLIYVAAFINFIKKENKETQISDVELECILDDMTPREFYIHKMSQTSLVWDEKTNMYVRNWSNNDST